MGSKRGMQVVPKGNLEEVGENGGRPQRSKQRVKEIIKERRIYGASDTRKEQKAQKQTWTDGKTGRRKKAKVACKGSSNARAERRSSEMSDVSEGQHQWYTAKKTKTKMKNPKGGW